MDISHLSVGNAAGTIKTIHEVEKACGRNAMTTITVGSITMKPKAGNTPDQPNGRVYYYDPRGEWSMNALGLPNVGFETFIKGLSDMVRMVRSAGKELIVSVAGESPEEYALMAEECYKHGVDSVELNLGCPNVWGSDGTQKPIPSYDPLLTANILALVSQRLKRQKKVDVKISPVENELLLVALAQAIDKSQWVAHVIGTNTIPNQERMGYDGHPALSFNGGNEKGGLAGSALSGVCYAVHRTMRPYLHHSVGFVAAGGVSGGTLLKHVNLGADGFRIATDYIEKRGPAAFTPILEEYAARYEQAE